jgi:ubiquinone/menaquinone biosynthesis C-methylase UbiE
VAITATDINLPMIELGKARHGMDHVVWQQADAMKLPFAEACFDLMVCQFGVMLFPDKQASFRESFRVLTPGGTYLFALWDD